jgi:hypothetical protein
VGRWVAMVARLVRADPGADIYAILASQAVSGELTRRLGQAQARAEAALNKAWPVAVSPYRARLVSDIRRAYEMAPGKLREEAVRAFQAAPPERRADAVSRKAAVEGWHLGLRNELTVAVAQTRREGEDVLARAESWQYKEWVTRRDPKVCEWCRLLASLGAIPVDQEFSYGTVTGWRQPPRVYLNLLSPPAHPRCRCRIMLVRAGGVRLVNPVPEQYLFMSAGLVRAVPEARYQALYDFHSAALRELGQELRRRS